MFSLVTRRTLTLSGLKPVLGVLVLVTGCASEPQTGGGSVPNDRPAIHESLWDCGSQGRLTANWPDENSLEVSFDGETWRLPRAISASGARYSDGVREAWEHQGSLRWRLADGTFVQCRRM